MNKKILLDSLKVQAICIALAPAAGLAEEAADKKKKSVDLGNVVITEAKNPVANLPASVTIVEGEELERQPILKGIDILRAIPGVMPVDYNQGAVPNEFVMRGFTGGHGNIAAVFLDGAPLNETTSHADGMADFNMLIPEEIERIEVIKGPFSALYGNYSRAGSINIITKKRVNERVGRFSAGSWGTQRGAVTLGSSDGRASHFYAMEMFKTDGYRDNSDMRRGNISAKWTYDLTPQSSLRAGVRLYTTDFNAPGYLPQSEWDAGNYRKSLFPFDGGKKDRREINLNYNYALSATDNIGITLFNYTSDLTRFADFGGGQREEYNALTGNMLKALYSKRGNYWTKEDTLLVGLDVLRESGDSTRWCTDKRVRGGDPVRCATGTAPSLDRDFVMNSYAAFVQGEARPIEPLKLTLGARYDMFKGKLNRTVGSPAGSFDNNLNVFSPKAGALYTLAPGYDLFGNVGSGFQLPDEFAKFDNPDLKPTRLVSYELGTRFRPSPRIRGSLAWFITDSRDEVVTMIDPVRGPLLVNKGKTRRQGFEGELSVAITQALMAFGNYTYNDARYKDFIDSGSDFSGKRIVGVPRHLFSAGFDYLDPQGFGGRLTVRGIGERMLTDDNTQSTGGYTVVDVLAYYRWKGYTFDIKASNILDKRYSDAVFYFSGGPQYGVSPPFNVMASIKTDF